LPDCAERFFQLPVSLAAWIPALPERRFTTRMTWSCANEVGGAAPAASALRSRDAAGVPESAARELVLAAVERKGVASESSM